MAKPRGSGYYGTPAWEALRLKALKRDKFTCVICGTLCVGRKRGGLSPYVDHIKPRERGRMSFDPKLDVLINLQTLCPGCHNRKGAWIDNNPKPQIGPDGFPADGEWSKS